MSIEPPLLKRIAGVKKLGQAGRKAEKGLAHRLGGKLTLASGAVASDKGDMKIEGAEHRFLLESKSTKNESLSVKLEWLLKIKQEALESASTPAFALSFTNDHGIPIRDGVWIAVPEATFIEMGGIPLTKRGNVV